MNFTTTDVLVGSAVTVKTSSGEKTAVIRFMGMTSFASGEWVGVELDTAEGKNSGCVNGLQYFHCKPNHGMFVRPHSVKKSCDGIAPSNKENLDKTSHTAPTIAILSKQNALSKPGPSDTHSVSMSTMSIKTGMSDFSITGKRKNKMKGKAGMLIYNKLVGEADGGKELPREEVEQLKEIYKKSWENRPYIYWMRKTPSRRECIRIRPQNKCHCSHTFKSHEWWDLKNRKGKCRVPGCQCTCFQYLHYQGSMTFNCKCRHAATKHRLNGAPSSCQHTETTLARSGKSTKRVHVKVFIPLSLANVDTAIKNMKWCGSQPRNDVRWGCLLIQIQLHNAFGRRSGMVVGDVSAASVVWLANLVQTTHGKATVRALRMTESFIRKHGRKSTKK